MSELTIITNNVPRELLSLWELSEKERADFDYVTEDNGTDRFFRYRGNVYDSHEFVRIVPRSKMHGFEHGVDAESPLLAWQGIQTDSYFSATLVRYTEDFERVIVGRCYS